MGSCQRSVLEYQNSLEQKVAPARTDQGKQFLHFFYNKTNSLLFYAEFFLKSLKHMK